MHLLLVSPQHRPIAESLSTNVTIARALPLLDPRLDRGEGDREMIRCFFYSMDLAVSNNLALFRRRVPFHKH